MASSPRPPVRLAEPLPIQRDCPFNPLLHFVFLPVVEILPRFLEFLWLNIVVEFLQLVLECLAGYLFDKT